MADLSIFCDKNDTREWLQTPFFVDIDGETYHTACDGYVLVAIKENGGPLDKVHQKVINVTLSPKTEKYTVDFDQFKEWVNKNNDSEICSNCEGSGEEPSGYSCEECDGWGRKGNWRLDAEIFGVLVNKVLFKMPINFVTPQEKVELIASEDNKIIIINGNDWKIAVKGLEEPYGLSEIEKFELTVN